MTRLITTNAMILKSQMIRLETLSLLRMGEEQFLQKWLPHNSQTEADSSGRLMRLCWKCSGERVDLILTRILGKMLAILNWRKSFIERQESSGVSCNEGINVYKS